MCSLNNAINLYREEAEEDNISRFIIVKRINGVNVPLKDKEGNIQYFDNMATADIERIYHQPNNTELLKVIEV